MDDLRGSQRVARRDRDVDRASVALVACGGAWLA
jgi:hypothetical protein